MPAVINHSVGEGGKNNPSDVMVIQALLNQVPDWRGGPAVKVAVTGLIDTATKYAIGNFQDYWFGWSDGRVDPGGVTLSFLNVKSRPLAESLPFLPTQPRYVPQVTFNRCWSAVGTMMHNWRHGTNYTMDGFASAMLNPYFKDVYELDKVLPLSRQPEYVTTTLKMKGAKAGDFLGLGVDGWLDVLKAFKAVVVQHKVTDGGQNYLHARILCGMSGMGKPNDTSVRIIDPWWGNGTPAAYPVYHAKLIPFWKFEAEFEEPTGQSGVLQVWHY